MLASGDFDDRRRSLEGDVLAPPDAGYDQARVCFNALADRRRRAARPRAGRLDLRRNQNIPPG